MASVADVTIVGGGPGGAGSALFLANRGVSSVIVESDPFPRFHIGESMTGECGGFVRQLGFTSKMSQQKHAVKHGVTVYGTGGKSTFWVPVMRRTETNELEAFQTWNVRRSQFDTMLLDAAQERGTELIRATAKEPIIREDGSVGGIRVVDAEGNQRDILSEVVIDASGRKTWLANAGVTGPKKRDKYDNQIAVFSHFKGAIREPRDAAGNVLIFYQKFLHWGWFIPLDDEIVSIGVVVPSKYFKARGEKAQDFLARELRELNPELASRVEDAEQVEEVRAATNYSYFVDEFTGPGYVCVGDSHRFIDPIFSFGLYLTLSDASMAAEVIADHLEGRGPSGPNPFIAYQQRCQQGLGVFQDLIDGFWGNPLSFGYMMHFTDHKEGIIDIFAGRVYRDGYSDAHMALKKVIATSPMWAAAGTSVGPADTPGETGPTLKEILSTVAPG